RESGARIAPARRSDRRARDCVAGEVRRDDPRGHRHTAAALARARGTGRQAATLHRAAGQRRTRQGADRPARRLSAIAPSRGACAWRAPSATAWHNACPAELHDMNTSPSRKTDAAPLMSLDEAVARLLEGARGHTIS